MDRHAPNAQTQFADPFAEGLDTRAGALPGSESRGLALAYGQGSRIATALNLTGAAYIRHPLLQDPTVYKCVELRWQASSAALLKVLDAQGEPVNPENSLAMLFDEPSWQLWDDAASFLQALSTHYDLWGGSALLLAKNGKPVNERGGRLNARGRSVIETPERMWPISWDRVTPKLDGKTGRVTSYTINLGAEKQEWPAHAVIPMYVPDPVDPWCAIAPWEAAARAANQNFTAAKFNDALLKRGGTPTVVLAPKAGNQVTAEQAKEIQRDYLRQSGNADQAGAPLVLAHEMDATPISYSPKDLQFDLSIERNRRTIMSIYGVTRPLMGDAEGMTYASVVEAHRIFWLVAILPRLNWWCATFTRRMIGRLEDPFSLYSVMPSTENIEALRGLEDGRIARTEKLMSLGLPLSEAAKLAGWITPGIDLTQFDGLAGFGALGGASGGPSIEGDATGGDAAKPIGDEPGGVTAAGKNAAAGSKLQDAALNGAQVAALVDIVSQVTLGTLPPESAKGLILAAFPTIDAGEVDRIVNPAAVFEPEPAPDAPAQPAVAVEAALSWPWDEQGAPLPAEPATRVLAESWAELTCGRGLVPLTEAEGVRHRARRAYVDVHEKAIQVGTLTLGGKIGRQFQLWMRAVSHDLESLATTGKLARGLVIERDAASESAMAALLERNRVKFRKEIARLVRQQTSTTWDIASKAAAKRARALAATIPATDPAVAEFLSAKAIKVAEGSTSIVAARVREALVETLDAGGAVGTVADRVREKLSDIKSQLEYMGDALQSRAMTIARTELNSSANTSTFDTFKNAGKKRKVWASSRDDQVRTEPHNHAIDGEAVDIDDQFSNGLRYPGEARGEAANIINCRCTLDVEQE